MGIREHLSKKVDEEDMKLSDLQLTTCENENTDFDFEAEMTDQDWQEIKNLVDTGLISANTERASDLQILAPNRLEELGIDINELIDDVIESLRGDRRDRSTVFPPHPSTSIYSIIEQAKLIKDLAPDRFNELGFESLQERIKQDLEEHQSIGGHFSTFIEEAVLLKIIDPKKLDEYRISNRELESIWTELKPKLDEYRRSNGWNGFAETAYKLRILFPERVNELGLDKKTLQSIGESAMHWYRKKTRVTKRNAWDSYLLAARRYKVLVAKEIKFTDRGLELVTEKKDFKTEPNKRPERKTF